MEEQGQLIFSNIFSCYYKGKPYVLKIIQGKPFWYSYWLLFCPLLFFSCAIIEQDSLMFLFMFIYLVIWNCFLFSCLICSQLLISVWLIHESFTRFVTPLSAFSRAIRFRKKLKNTFLLVVWKMRCTPYILQMPEMISLALWFLVLFR